MERQSPRPTSSVDDHRREDRANVAVVTRHEDLHAAFTSVPPSPDPGVPTPIAASKSFRKELAAEVSPEFPRRLVHPARDS
jgi:hypothetical protein